MAICTTQTDCLLQRLFQSLDDKNSSVRVVCPYSTVYYVRLTAMTPFSHINYSWNMICMRRANVQEKRGKKGFCVSSLVGSACLLSLSLFFPPLVPSLSPSLLGQSPLLILFSQSVSKYRTALCTYIHYYKGYHRTVLICVCYPISSHHCKL